MRSNARIYGWGRSRESIPGAAHWRWRFDEEAFSGRLWMFFLGGRGRGRGVPGRVLLRSFRRTAGSKQPILCYILYVEQWRFRCSMSSGHRERGFFDPRTPWADACDVSGFNNSSTCSHSDDSGGAAAPRSTRTPRSSGYDFLCTCGLCCYMLYVYYMLYACYMSSSEPSSGSSGSVWIYRRAIFGKQNWLCARTSCTMYRRAIFGEQN